jgi:hypothetical protein
MLPPEADEHGLGDVIAFILRGARRSDMDH